MAWIVFPNKYFDANGGGDVVTVVDTVDRMMFSMYPNCVFLEGDIMRNIVFWDFILPCFGLKIRFLFQFFIIWR